MKNAYLFAIQLDIFAQEVDAEITLIHRRIKTNLGLLSLCITLNLGDQDENRLIHQLLIDCETLGFEKIKKILVEYQNEKKKPNLSQEDIENKVAAFNRKTANFLLSAKKSTATIDVSNDSDTNKKDNRLK